MTIPFWRPNVIAPERTPWDIVYLDGKDLPGVSTCEIEPVRAIETVHEKNTDGNTQKDNGYKGSKVAITVTIWEEAQLKELNAMVPNFHPRKPGGEAAPVTLEHPAALLLGVTGIRVTKIKVPKPSGGMLVMIISAEEFFPATKKSNKRNTPGGFPPKTSGGKFRRDPQDPPGPKAGAKFP